jgi:dTMP kinase
MYIVFEGVDKVGKSTQAKMLNEYLEYRWIKDVTGEPLSVLVSEPSDDAFGKKIRELTLSKEIETTSAASFLLYLASMANNAKKLNEFKKQNIHIIGDRSFLSTMVYQSLYAAKLDPKEILRTVLLCGIPIPDMVILLRPENSNLIVGRPNKDSLDSRLTKGMVDDIDAAYADIVCSSFSHKTIVVKEGDSKHDVNRQVLSFIEPLLVGRIK